MNAPFLIAVAAFAAVGVGLSYLWSPSLFFRRNWTPVAELRSRRTGLSLLLGGLFALLALALAKLVAGAF